MLAPTCCGCATLIDERSIGVFPVDCAQNCAYRDAKDRANMRCKLLIFGGVTATNQKVGSSNLFGRATLLMSKHILTFCVVCSLPFLALSLYATSCAQETEGNKHVDIPSLIKKLEHKDDRAVLSAVGELIKAGQSIVPLLVDSLKQKKGCQFQFAASGVIYQLDKKNGVVNSVLIDIVRGKCKGRSRNDLIIRRQAAFALVGKAEGIPVIAEMLKDKDTFIRRSAAFVFDELTERLAGRPPEVKAEVLFAAKAALPALVQALSDKDEIVRCMSLESLEQVQYSKHEELRSEANRLM